MSNLEELNLHLGFYGKDKFIEGNNIKDLINNMIKLNKFIFNIYSIIGIKNKTNLPTNEDILYTLRDLKTSQINSCINFHPKRQDGQCHFYSYPYVWKTYNYITNNFSGGLFKTVREVTLNDERPFEHEFFFLLAQSFPFLKKLTIINKEKQTNQQCIKSNEYYKNLSIIQYPYLIELDLLEAHNDYVEQFLIDAKTCLPNNLYFMIEYKRLKIITHNFRRVAAQINLSKIRYDDDLDF